MELTDLLTRKCPNLHCEATFTLSWPMPQGRSPIYCEECRHSKHTDDRTTDRICPWPPCRTRFTLRPDQAAATTFCCPDHKTKHQNTIRMYKPPVCHNIGCINPLPIQNVDRHYYCSTACATAHHAHFKDTNPDRLLCKRPACTNTIPYDPTTLRRIPRFCSQTCRDAFAPLTETPAATTQRSHRNQRRFRKVKLQGLETAIALHNPANRTPWEHLPTSLQNAYAKDGWTAASWASYPGPYSPAALQWAVLGEPQHCDLSHITVLNAAAMLPPGVTPSTTDFWNEME